MHRGLRLYLAHWTFTTLLSVIGPSTVLQHNLEMWGTSAGDKFQRFLFIDAGTGCYTEHAGGPLEKKLLKCWMRVGMFRINLSLNSFCSLGGRTWLFKWRTTVWNVNRAVIFNQEQPTASKSAWTRSAPTTALSRNYAHVSNVSIHWLHVKAEPTPWCSWSDCFKTQQNTCNAWSKNENLSI